jgi:hypothetical protein
VGRALRELDSLGLPRCVRVSAAGVHVQLLEHATTHGALRQHALDGELQDAFRMLLQQLLERNALDAADGARVVVVELVNLMPDLEIQEDLVQTQVAVAVAEPVPQVAMLIMVQVA